MQHIGKILPIDGYRVQLPMSLPMDYDESIIHLYQPLIGLQAVNLYMFLVKEIPLQTETTIQTHHTIMNYLNIPLDQIYEARRKLEGIGLLQTYELQENDKTVYTYILRPPFRPNFFFQDMMLSELLYRHVGKVKFEALRAHYVREDKTRKGTNVTATFNDVFTTYSPDHAVEHQAEKVEVDQPNIPLEKVSFDSIYFLLQQKNIRPDKVLTDKHIEVMTQLKHFYDLEMYEMEQAVQWAITEENSVDIALFKQACEDIFQMKHNVAKVQLHDKQTVNKAEKKEVKKQHSKIDTLIDWFEKASPKDILEDYSMGNNASLQELRMLSEVMLRQNLPKPVMNVLIHYVLLQSDQKITRGYVEAIAAHWSRKHLQTAKEAMDFAREQMQQAKQKQTKKQAPRYSNRKQTNGKEEVIPDWFNKRGKEVEKEEAKPLTEADKKEQEALLKELKRHASKNN